MPDGYLYGIANQQGSSLPDTRPSRFGTIFRVRPDGSSCEILKAFTLATLSDGANPTGLVRGSDGNLYGTIEAGGANDVGTIFRLKFSAAPPAPPVYQLIHSFNCATGADKGGDPFGVLTEGPDGALYGTTDAASYAGCGSGTVFKINKDASGFTILSRFNDPVTGSYTWVPVARDGSIFGTTFDSLDGLVGPVKGTIFKVPDLVDGQRALVCVPAAGSNFLPGTTTDVTCTSGDAKSPTPNTSAARFKLIVNLQSDITPPVITLPPDMVLEATGPDGAAVTFTVTAVDAVDGNRPITCVPSSGSTFPLGTTTVTCKAADAAGNTSTKTFTVTVVKKPTLTVKLSPAFCGRRTTRWWISPPPSRPRLGPP